jgi:hypothetical protein
MESKSKLSTENNDVVKEKDSLKDIVEAVFRTDIMSSRRYQSIVEARMVFAKILVDRGHSLSSIGKYINKNHATIIYYNKHLTYLLEQYPYLFNKYLQCKNAFLHNREPVIFLKERNVQSMMTKLMEKVDELIREKEELRSTLKSYKRFERIVELLHDKAKHYDDGILYQKINKIFN